MARIELSTGRRARPVRRGRQGITRYDYVRPVFGPRCVCCRTDRLVTPVPYQPRNTLLVPRATDVPVCIECYPHALRVPHRISPVELVGVGAGVAAFGLYYLVQHPWSTLAAIAMVAGAGMVAGGVAWLAQRLGRDRELREHGHHPGLSLGADDRRTIVDTTSEALVDELLELNPAARRRLEHGLGKDEVPEARLLAPRDD